MGSFNGVQMKLPFLVALIVVIAPSISRACLNDRDVLVSEREFRSEYLQQGSMIDDAATHFPLGWIATAAGGLLTVGSVVVLRRKPRDFPPLR
jgi:hypothetical protein